MILTGKGGSLCWRLSFGHHKLSFGFCESTAEHRILGLVIASVLKAGPQKILSTSAAMVALIAAADWYVGNKASLGVLYILPMMLSGIVLTPLQTVAAALLCASLRSCFDLPSPPLEVLLRFVFAALAYSGSGLFVIALIRNRQLAIEHLTRIGREQELRQEAEEQLKVLVESSPAAILTLNEQASVIAANRAASSLFMIGDNDSLMGRSIADYVPVLADALQLNNGLTGLCTAAQCQGRRDNGEIFLANTWFSSYAAPRGKRLAAIVVDASEEMRDREEQSLSQLMRGNRIAAAAVSHEVRNLCSAISLICSSLQSKVKAESMADQQDDVRSLATLVSGLETIASSELRWQSQERLEEIALQHVLDDLRIVIEPAWREIDGLVRWKLPVRMPVILADRRGLLQAFLNLAHNSLRAVQERNVRELTISVAVEEQKAFIRFCDTGPGIAATERLFEPFQPGAEGSGLGLYVSRAVVRGYGGELRNEPVPSGSCFAVEVQRCPEK
jgi:two-component system sensor kinase FixL